MSLEMKSKTMEEEFSHLYQYGIEEEESDIRAHVTDRHILVFKTDVVYDLINSGKYKQRPAYQQNYDKPTALGYLIPYKDIPDIRMLKFYSWNEWSLFDKSWTTAEKGKWAIRCVVELLRIGHFPIWIEAEQTTDTNIDIRGTDILIYMNHKIQVKCDYPAISTGNLYIQTHESNPFKLH